MRIIQENLILKHMSDKPVLAIETSQSLCSTCIYYNDNHYFQAEFNLKNAHAEKIFTLIDHVIAAAGISFSSLAAVAVSSGPGSFTGLRIGMSAAKGIAFGAGLPIISVPTFEALALQISSFLGEGTSFVIANKVNMEELYYARFQVLNNSYIFTEDLKIIKKIELDFNAPDLLFYGNGTGLNSISSPDAFFVAKMSRHSGLKSIEDFDNLEPGYLKNFIIKEKKK
jgi:tRNA threonylcarbamoyladenosine biosynthesis protein TsaB